MVTMNTRAAVTVFYAVVQRLPTEFKGSQSEETIIFELIGNLVLASTDTDISPQPFL